MYESKASVEFLLYLHSSQSSSGSWGDGATFLLLLLLLRRLLFREAEGMVPAGRRCAFIGFKDAAGWGSAAAEPHRCLHAVSTCKAQEGCAACASEQT